MVLVKKHEKVLETNKNEENKKKLQLGKLFDNSR